MEEKKADTSQPRKDEFTDEEIRRGRRAVRYVRVICIISLAIIAVSAVVPFFLVPISTRMPYNGLYGHNGIPLPIAVIPAFVAPIGLWRESLKKDADHMHAGSRGITYVLGTILILGSAFVELMIVHSILKAGGAI